MDGKANIDGKIIEINRKTIKLLNELGEVHSCGRSAGSGGLGGLVRILVFIPERVLLLQGAFGVVMKGEMTKDDGTVVFCACKTLKVCL